MGRKVIATKPRADPKLSTGKKRDRSAEWKPRKFVVSLYICFVFLFVNFVFRSASEVALFNVLEVVRMDQPSWALREENCKKIDKKKGDGYISGSNGHCMIGG